MKWIGLTGGIASGKSTVSRMLKAKGIPVIDADEIAKDVVKAGSPGLKAVVQDFGPDILMRDGSLDRRKLGELVFGRADLLRRLEGLLHPLIQAETLKRRQQLEEKGEMLAVYDIPLLFEINAQKQFDYIVVVSCKPEQQKVRLGLRNAFNEKEIEERLAAQIPLPVKEQEADFVVHNDRDESFLSQEVTRLLVWLENIKKA